MYMGKFINDYLIVVIYFVRKMRVVLIECTLTGYK
jgi:hypothetical protein